MSKQFQPMLNSKLKAKCKGLNFYFGCDYHGCGADDSWPTFTRR